MNCDIYCECDACILIHKRNGCNYGIPFYTRDEIIECDCIQNYEEPELPDIKTLYKELWP